MNNTLRFIKGTPGFYGVSDDQGYIVKHGKLWHASYPGVGRGGLPHAEWFRKLNDAKAAVRTAANQLRDRS